MRFRHSRFPLPHGTTHREEVVWTGAGAAFVVNRYLFEDDRRSNGAPNRNFRHGFVLPNGPR